MVSVFVGVGNGMNDANAFADQLSTKIWRSVDQQVALGQSKDDRTPSPLVFRVVALANVATATD